MLGRSVRTSQPQGPARVDWSNPITRGMTVANTGNSKINLVDGKSEIATSGVTTGTSPAGQSAQALSSAVPRYWRTSSVGAAGSSVFFVGKAQNLGSATVYAGYAQEGVNSGYLATIDGGSFATYSLPNYLSRTTTRPTDGTNFTGAVVATATVLDSWLNGVKHGTGLGGGYGSLTIAGYVEYANAAVNKPANGLMFCAWGRMLSDSEIKSLTANPWQIFAPDSKSLWTPAAASVTLPTLVQPNSTTSAGAWTATGAASLHAAINELVPSDTQYISVNSASTTELLLAEAAFPGAANQTLAYRASSTQGSTLTVTLKQGATQIMTRTHALTGADTLYTQTLTAPEIALITSGAISVTLTTS